MVFIWLLPSWWRYLFSDLPSRWFGEEGALERVICRAKGHAGEVFYNPMGDEPDHHCRGCGEYLG